MHSWLLQSLCQALSAYHKQWMEEIASAVAVQQISFSTKKGFLW